MSRDSSTLFLLANETRQSDERRKPPTTGESFSALDGSLVEAGKLRIRMNSAVGVMDQIRGRRRPFLLVDPSQENTSSQWGTFFALEIPESRREKWGFLKHVREYLRSILTIFFFMGLIIGLLGLCAFYLGVVLPFGLQ